MEEEIVITAFKKTEDNQRIFNLITGEKGYKIQKRGNVRNLDAFISSVNCYSELDNLLGGNKRPSDLDCYYERNGNILNIEMKLTESAINRGQLITFANGALIGYMTTLIVIGKDLLNPEKIIVIYPNKISNEPRVINNASLNDLKNIINNWYKYADLNPVLNEMWNVGNIFNLENKIKAKLN